MKWFAALMLISLLLTGSLAQSYTQKVEAIGDSTISESRDISSFLSLLPADALMRIDAVCKADPSLDCSLQDTILTMNMDLEDGNDYYAFQTDNGFPFVTTTLTISKIPSDLFDARINSILLQSKLVSDEGSAKPIDLSEKSANRAKAEALKRSGFEVMYSVQMPNGQLNSYDLVAILEDSKPLIIQTQEINSWTIVLLLGIGLVAFVAYTFFGNRSGRKKSGHFLPNR